MPHSRFLGIALVLLILSACQSVIVDEPIGEIPCVLDPEEWEGAWLLDHEIMMVDVLDAENGVLRISGIEKGQDGDLRVETMTIYVRDGGAWLLGSMGDPEGEDPGYLWAAAKRQDDQLILFEPDSLKFRALVEEGILPGWLDGNDVHLGPLEPEHVALILSGEHGFLFDIDDRIGVAIRVTH